MLENKNNNKLNWNKGELGERNKMGFGQWLWKTANQQVAGADILLFFSVSTVINALLCYFLIEHNIFRNL